MEGSKSENEFSREAASSSSVSPRWIDLPADVTANILHRLGTVDMINVAQMVCTTWWRICQDPATWRVIHITNSEGSYSQMIIACRRVMKLSQGQLVDLTLDNFGCGNMLKYITNRSSDLKRLTLKRCLLFMEDGVPKALKKHPQLEELHLIGMRTVSPYDIISIGISCPNLKSFAFSYGFWHPSITHVNFGEYERNEYALVIANTMPNLCHLNLVANPIDNQGLEAILDGCPNLESLDLRQCFRLDLRGALGKRCCEQIKHLKFPLDTVTFIEYLTERNERDFDPLPDDAEIEIREMSPYDRRCYDEDERDWLYFG